MSSKKKRKEPLTIEQIAAKYPKFADDILKYKGEILKIYELYTDVINDEYKPTNPQEMGSQIIEYAKVEKYNKFYSHYPPLFYTIMMSKVFSIAAAIKYLNEYHEGGVIDNKERYLSVCKVYFVNFTIKLLKNNHIEKQTFVPYYMEQMENLFDHISSSLKKTKEYETIKKENEEKNKSEQLRKSLKKIDLDKMSNIIQRRRDQS